MLILIIYFVTNIIYVFYITIIIFVTMQRDNKCQRTRKIKLLRTIQTNKRTISSEQSYYHYTKSSVRKFTLQNQETKKNLYKNTAMSRKNQSLPKTLAALNMYDSNPAKPFRHHNKRMSSITQIKLNEQPKQQPQKIQQLQLHKYTNTKGRNLVVLTQEAQILYRAGKYKEARKCFQEICTIAKNQYSKSNYYLGMCQYWLCNHDKAIYALHKILEDKNFIMPVQGYSALAEAYEKTKNHICALKILDQWIRVESNQKAYLMRARINFSFKEYDKSISDYQQCYYLNPQKLEAYIQEAQATFYLQGLDKALQKYNNLLVNYKSIWPQSKYIDINYVKYKKSLLLLHEKKYTVALSLLEQVTNPEIKTQIQYYKGIIHSIMANNSQTNDFEDAIGCFNKAINANTMQRFVAQSYYQKFVLMFKKNDFYGIQHELDLIENRFSQHEPLSMIERLIQGVISILKMNFKQGIKLMDELTNYNKYYVDNKSVQKIFRSTIFSLKSFAYYSIRKFKEASQQLQILIKLNKASMSSTPNQYNYIMLTGILQVFDGHFSESLSNFEKADQIQPFNSHTSMIKAVTEILFYQSLCKLSHNVSAKNTIQHNDNSSGKKIKNNDCHEKTRKKVSIPNKKRQSAPTHKVCHNKNNYDSKKQTIMIDSSYGTTQNIGNDSHNKQILLSAEQLLNRCLLKQPQNDQILCLLASIYYALQQYETGLKYIRKAIDSSDDHMIRHYYIKANLRIMSNMTEQAISDYTNALLVVSQQQNQQKQQNRQQLIPQIYLQRAKCYILEGSKSKAQADLKLFFNDLQIVRKYEHELDLFMHVGCADLIIEIYKNILDKQYDLYSRMKCYYLAKQLNSCLTIMNALLDFQTSSDYEGIFDPLKLAVDCQCLEALRKSSQGSKIIICDALRVFQKIMFSGQYGTIFTKSDCMFFAGVLSFYSEDYSKAKNYFIDSKGQKILLDQIQQSKVDNDDENYENRTYTLEQINYNIGICDYVQGKWSPYLDDHADFKKKHQNVTQNLLASAEQITPFPIKNRLCSIYGPEQQGNMIFRLSFCLPPLKLRQVTFHKNPLILQKISFKDIDMRPSAPWIHKNRKGIVFTGQLIKQSIDLKSQKSKKANKNKRGQNRYKQQL